MARSNDRWGDGEVPRRPDWGHPVNMPIAIVLLAGLLAMAGSLPGSASQGLPAGVRLTGDSWPVSTETVPKWQAVLERHGTSQKLTKEPCAADVPGACALQDWWRFLDRIADKPLWEQLWHVNIAINRVPYAEDIEVWGRVDRWAAPQDFFAHGGDCEDYAISKYFSLRALGVPARDLLLTAIFDDERKREHLVLVVLLPDGAVVLDNESNFILPWRADGPYRTAYLLNEKIALFNLADTAAR